MTDEIIWPGLGRDSRQLTCFISSKYTEMTEKIGAEKSKRAIDVAQKNAVPEMEQN